MHVKAGRLTQEDGRYIEIDVRLFEFIGHLVNTSQIDTDDVVICGVQVRGTETDLTI